jgi:NAD(P)H-dependent flavin oxidoreductase YrpB (nitropropane dioxygenase family)
MSLSNRYTEMVGIRYPILQDGLGLSPTARLAAAVSNAGGLGTVSMPGTVTDPRETRRRLREQIDECMGLTNKTFAVNIPAGRDSSGNLLSFTEPLLGAVLEARRSDPAIERQLRVVTTAAGSPKPFRERLSAAGLIHQHKVGTTAQAKKAAEAGVDVIVAMGAEGGAHISKDNVHTFVLGPNVLDAVSIPVLLAGGIRDGRGLAAALAMGASGVAMGTRFLVSEDSSWHPRFAEALLRMQEGDDVAFAANYGNCRALRNKASLALIPGATPVHVPSAQIYDKLQAMVRAQDEGDIDTGLVLTGQVASGITDKIRVAEFLPRMAQEAERVIAKLARNYPLTLESSAELMA